MKFEDHCKETEGKLGERFPEVHSWLDEFAGSDKYKMRHRRVRHHQAGVDEVKRKWGESAAEAAELHIVSDLKEEGWKENDHFPEDEKDYVSMGLF